MSRRGGPSAASTLDPTSDICPVCKSNRYLNPNLTFLINSECYHIMCTSCVDRIFTSGPAPCPVAGCHKTLRKRGFHAAFFGDLTIEREVDVRKRVAAVFNRRQDEFVSLLEWNNYLEQVEELVFEIVNGSEKERRAAEERLKEYAESNKREIEENLLAEREAGEEEKRREEAEIDAARRRRALAARQVAEERAEVAKTKRDVLDRLAGTNEDAGKITRQAEKILAMNQERRRGEMAEANARSSGLTIRGLRQKVKAEPEKPYDPFGGLDITPTRFVLQNDYKNDWLESAKNDTRHMSGGYSLHEYYYRTMFEAFSGLGVFIEDEAQDRQASPLARRTAATGTPGIKTNGDDIF